MTTDLEPLGRAIKAAQHRQHRTLERALGAIGSTVVQWDALRAIERMEGASAHDLALATFQSDQAFGTLSNRLEAQGLIERRAGAGRKIEHRLTPGGAKVLEEGNAIAGQVRTELFAPLSEPDRQALQRILQHLLGSEG